MDKKNVFLLDIDLLNIPEQFVFSLSLLTKYVPTVRTVAERGDYSYLLYVQYSTVRTY